MRGPRRWWEVVYSVVKIGGSTTVYFDKKSAAMSFAVRQCHGDWAVWRHGPFNMRKRLAVIGGHWSDWPEYDTKEDY